MEDPRTKLMEIIAKEKSNFSKFLQKLVSFNTTIVNGGKSGNEGDAQLWLAEQMRRIDLDVDIFLPDKKMIHKDPEFVPGRDYTNRPNVVAVMKGKQSSSARSVTLHGHMDTVATGLPDLWTYEPFSARIVEGKLYGIGSCDQKGGLAAAVAALQTLKKAHVELLGDVVLESVVDEEEGGGNGTLACIKKGYRTDCVVCTEPTELQVCNSELGELAFGLEVVGKASHGAIKWDGVSAIDQMVKIIGALNEIEKRRLKAKKHAILPSPPICISTINGGTAIGTVPDHCKIEGTISYLPNEVDESGRGKNVRTQIEKEIFQLIQGDSWLQKHPPILHWGTDISPFEISTSEPVVVAALDVVKQLQRPAVPGGFPSGSDARLFYNTGKTPPIIWGPGSLRQAHQIDEYIEVEEYIHAIRAYSLFLVEWCGTRPCP